MNVTGFGPDIKLGPERRWVSYSCNRLIISSNRRLFQNIEPDWSKGILWSPSNPLQVLFFLIHAASGMMIPWKPQGWPLWSSAGINQRNCWAELPSVLTLSSSKKSSCLFRSWHRFQSWTQPDLDDPNWDVKNTNQIWSLISIIPYLADRENWPLAGPSIEECHKLEVASVIVSLFSPHSSIFFRKESNGRSAPQLFLLVFLKVSQNKRMPWAKLFRILTCQ